MRALWTFLKEDRLVQVKGSKLISAIVLAAGESERMDCCKQLLQVRGEGMLERVISSVRKSKVEDVLVVLGHNSQEIEESISDDVETVINPDYEKGMSTSLKVGMRELSEKTDAVLFVLADQPLLEPETIDAIIKKYERSGSQIIAPFYRGKRGNPVLLDMSLEEEIMNIRGDIGAREILNNREDEIEMVEVDTPSVVMDVDTEEDIEKVRKFLEG